MSSTEIEFETVRDLVRDLLKKEPRCRNDDKWLIYRVMSHFTRVFIPYDDFDKFPSYESVSRCRRKIQYDEGLFLPTDPDVLRKRRIKTDEVKIWALKH